MGQPIIFSQTLAAASANNIATSQSPGSGAITLNGSTVANGVATLDTQRRILITSGGSDAGITFTVNGTNQAGYKISDTFAGGATTAASNLDFKTVTSVTHTGSVASTITIGTNTTGSTMWQILNWNQYPFDIGIVVELRSGSATFAIEYTLDDPNNLIAGLDYPLPFGDATIKGTATIAGNSTIPVTAFRLTTTLGTGTLWVRALQSGLGSP